MKKLKARDLPQLNARVEPPVKRGVDAVCKTSGLKSQTLVADALRYYFGSVDAAVAMRRDSALRAAKALYGADRNDHCAGLDLPRCGDTRRGPS